MACPPNGQRRRSLHYAALGGHSEIISLLIKYGANPLSWDQHATPLHWFAESDPKVPEQRIAEVIKALTRGSDNPSSIINAYRFVSKTPLELAVELGNISLIKQLLLFGANPNEQFPRFHSPLFSALKLPETTRSNFEAFKGFETMA